jgi:hypothetical protein
MYGFADLLPLIGFISFSVSLERSRLLGCFGFGLVSMRIKQGTGLFCNL